MADHSTIDHTGITGAGAATHIADATDAHDASAISFTPAGTIAATDVQAAIEEVASEAGGGGAFVGAAVTHSANLALNNGSDTIHSFNTESGEKWLYDTDGFHDNVTNNSRLTVPTGLGGYYVATACIFFTASANGNYRIVNFKINGTDEVGSTKYGDIGALSMAVNAVSPPLLLVATDYVECVVNVDGASLESIVVAGQGPLFSLHRVGT